MTFFYPRRWAGLSSNPTLESIMGNLTALNTAVGVLTKDVADLQTNATANSASDQAGIDAATAAVTAASTIVASVSASLAPAPAA